MRKIFCDVCKKEIPSAQIFHTIRINRAGCPERHFEEVCHSCAEKIKKAIIQIEERAEIENRDNLFALMGDK